MKCIWK